MKLCVDIEKRLGDFHLRASFTAEEETLALLEAEGFTVNEVDVEVRRKMGEIMNAAVKEDIIALCGEEIYNLVMDAVVAQRQS